MNVKLFALAGLAGLFLETGALAESCNVQVTGPKGDWKFLQVYDVATGEVVLRQVIKSGDSKPVETTGDKIRIDWKLAGYKHYRTGPTVTCKGGNIVRF